MFFVFILNMLKKFFKKKLDNHYLIKGFLKVLFNNAQIIFIDYKINPKPRWGYGKPSHKKLYEIINKNRKVYENNLKLFLKYKNNFLKISKHFDEKNPSKPNWINSWFSGLDTVSLYGLIVMNKPKRYFEIGSGNSTKVARQAINDFSLKTRIVSFDPFPRAEIDSICDKIIRKPVEDSNLKIFEELEGGDVLFVDNSHNVFMNSDATTVFLDILPYLKKGVIVGFHDILLPNDYLPEWKNSVMSEQYVLAGYLLAEGKKFEIIFPTAFVGNDDKLKKILSPLWNNEKMKGVANKGGSFWIRMN
jgi:uncharacterized protein YegJ (DUF2314 family)